MAEGIVEEVGTAIATTEAPAVVAAPEPDIVHLVARNPQEMVAAQANLAVWFQNKVINCDAEVKELTAAVAEAKLHKWKHSTLENQRSRAATRLQFYQKCLTACELGYTIIPNIPVDVFAIRTTRTKPAPQPQRTEGTSSWNHPHVPDERPKVLAVGEGDYQSPTQVTRTTHSTYKNDKNEDVHVRTAKAIEFDSVEFPIIAAVPSVMSATQRAMAARVFDQIGVSPQNTRKGDPLIIGQILGVHRGYAGRQTLSFLIAWHLDLRTI